MKVDSTRFRICTIALFYQIPFYQIQSSPKYLTAQTVFDDRAVERPWTDTEMEKINSRNNEYGWEQQQAARHECRHIMTP
jgi:hypothetical protein